MDHELFLHKKISKLQLQLLDFHQKISPVKGEPESRNHSPEAIPSSDQPLKMPFSIMRALICLLCPLVFPTLIYSIEGYCPLFWQVTAISSCVTMLLLMTAFSFLGFQIRQIVNSIYEMLSSTQSKVKIVVQDTDGQGSQRNYRYAAAAILLFISALGFLAYRNDLAIVFNLCLVAGGLVTGMSIKALITWKKRNQLPFVSPLKSKCKERPSPRRELDFCTPGKTPSPSLSPNSCFSWSPSASPEKNVANAEFLGMALLPVSPSKHQAAGHRSQR